MNLYPASSWRLLVDGPGEGASNMAVDEAILGAVAEGASPPTLRFYAWAPPCLSLGRSQSETGVDARACAAAGIGCVRRPTGGRAILHKDELTYSICLPLTDPRAHGDILESYRHLSEGLADGLRALGLDIERAQPRTADDVQSAACFDAPAGYELTVRGRKLLGSAQFRARGALLQHGSLPLFGDIAGVANFLDLGLEEREGLRMRLRATAITLEGAAGRRVTFEGAMQAIRRGIAHALNVDLTEGRLSTQEEIAARSLYQHKYADICWPRVRRAEATTAQPETIP
jgi:lipoate-protein ligase A